MTPHVLYAKRRVESRHVKRPERDERNVELSLCHHEEVAAEASVRRSGQSSLLCSLDPSPHYLIISEYTILAWQQRRLD